jgi:hypothetical protein
MLSASYINQIHEDFHKLLEGFNTLEAIAISNYLLITPCSLLKLIPYDITVVVLEYEI